MYKIKYRYTNVIYIFTWLVAANVLYVFHDPIGWVVTLSFFLFMPGYLLLLSLGHKDLLRHYKLVFALGLSLLILMVVGLLLNQTVYLGVSRPLSTKNIFASLDLVVMLLLAFSYTKLPTYTIWKKITFPELSSEAWCIIFLSLVMPLLAILGAIRLNNGGSNILTMTLFTLIPFMYLWLIIRTKIEYLNTLVIFASAFAILLTVSMRGSVLIGHDVQKEFYTFQIALQQQHWSIASFRDAFNACLSITILPVLFNKITSISPIYIYKIVYQLLFAASLIPIYLFTEIVTNKKIALICSLVFISFPVFLNEMPFLNRQEIAFIYFALLLLAMFIPSLSKKQASILSFLMITGLIFSHYSSTYVALGLFLIAKLTYSLLGKLKLNTIDQKQNAGVFKISWIVLLVTFMATFLWNVQVTGTGSGVFGIISSTVTSTLNHSGSQAVDTSYRILGPAPPNVEELLAKYATNSKNQSNYTQVAIPQILPPTKTGHFLIKRKINIISLNIFSKQSSAYILQVLLVCGVIIMGFKLKKNRSDVYKNVLSLTIASIILLAIQTTLPTLSVEYGTQRMFQQLLLITSIPIVIAAMSFFSINRKFDAYKCVGIFFVVLSMVLTNYFAQLIGGYQPVLALNNVGDNYDEYYIHTSEVDTAAWLQRNRDSRYPVEMDSFSILRFSNAVNNGSLVPAPLTGPSKNSYIYQNYANLLFGLYHATQSGTTIGYNLTTNINEDKNVIYSNGESDVLR